MPSRPHIPVWKTAPFIRLLIPLIAGILLQWYLQFPLPALLTAFTCFLLDFVLMRFLPLSFQYKVQALHGIIINLLLISFGALITWQKDIRHNDNWFGNYYHNGNYLVVRIDEPPIEKAKSNKADGYVKALLNNDTTIACKGKLLLYFSKDSAAPALHYGDIVLIHKNLQSIKNSGNPGAFNYERYAAFQQTFNNVFLKKDDWVLLNEKEVNPFSQFIFNTRESILSIIRDKVKSDKDELGIAEALLIGYTNDLDKDLVQAYSNTGVVHIIAISGMHLGLIYVILLWVFNRIPFIKKSELIKIIATLSCLWIFSLLTGGSASVLRSAVVFTCIAIGKGFDKKSSVYNSLAASAFILLSYNPYMLWDVGFQLSYCAVISIIVFQKPVYNWFYIKNKWGNKLWEMISVTLAAQLLTFPVCVYYFHQFPVLFLVTNLVAIPLSTVILFAEIFLIALAWVPFVGTYLGKATQLLTWLMNKFILWINELPFALVDGLPASVLSTWLLYAMVIGFSAWLMNKNKMLLRLSLTCTLLFTIQFAYNNWQVQQQSKLIVYNVPRYQAADFIDGNNYQFIGDSALSADAMLQNFHLKPGRIALQLNKRTDSLNDVFNKKSFYQFKNKRVLFVNEKISFIPPKEKINVDIIVISKNPKVYISQLANVFNCNEYVFDASNSLWKIDKWKKDCEKLHLRCYSIPEQGAFVLNAE